jgi:DtxR family Mn-dependent transcriptional regulator
MSSVAQDYVKAIWSAQEWSSDQATTKMLATRFGVSASTVSQYVRRLVAQGLVEHAPYGAIELTESGRVLALAMVRRHRLLETFLVRELGYTWDEVHRESEVLEHAVSDRLINRIDARLGHPDRDPHGDPIPRSDGTLLHPDLTRLDHLVDGAAGVVERVSDSDSDVLRYLASLGVRIGSSLVVVGRQDAAGVISIALDGDATPAALGLPAAQAVWVSHAQPA